LTLNFCGWPRKGGDLLNSSFSDNILVFCRHGEELSFEEKKGSSRPCAIPTLMRMPNLPWEPAGEFPKGLPVTLREGHNVGVRKSGAGLVVKVGKSWKEA